MQKNFLKNDIFPINTQVYNLFTIDIKEFTSLKLRVKSYPKGYWFNARVVKFVAQATPFSGQLLAFQQKHKTACPT